MKPEWMLTPKEIVAAYMNAGIETRLPDGNAIDMIDKYELKLMNEVVMKAQAKKLVEQLSQFLLYVAESPPKEGEKYTYLGSYILKWEEEANPSVGFREFWDTEVGQQFKKEVGLD